MWFLCIPATAWVAKFDLAVIHWSLSPSDPEVAIGQCRSVRQTVAIKALPQGANNVVIDAGDSSGPPLPHQSNLMWASTSKNYDVYSRKNQTGSVSRSFFQVGSSNFTSNRFKCYP